MDRTFLLTLQFDGAAFAGWQRQPEARTVQAEIEAALARICDRRIVAHAAGRTDAGVHADGMGVSCMVPARWAAEPLRHALNALLPDDCWIVSAREARRGFHARRSATGRRYRYEIGTDEASRSPFRRRWEWPLGRQVDLPSLQRAAGTIAGEHDFHRLSVRSSPRPHYRCTITDARWSARADGTGVRFQVAADRFLHHMVRMLVGTMVDVGLGRRAESDLRRLLDHDPAVRTSPPAPAQGLFFAGADYPAHCFLLEPASA